MSRVALVTGGTRGIGAAIAVGLKNAGYRVAVNYAGNDEAAQKFKAETGIAVYKWSVADYDACAEGIAKVEADLGPVEVRSTMPASHPRLHVPQDDARAVERGDRHQPQRRLQHDASGLDRHAGQEIRPHRHHLLINGQKGQMGQANYSAAKAGDIGFTKALAQEGARAGITVNVICPGYIATDMVMAVPEKVREAIIAQIPVGRLGEAEEIARCVVFLASDEAGFITGSTLTANGGQYLT